jgi:hypothetical protein
VTKSELSRPRHAAARVPRQRNVTAGYCQEHGDYTPCAEHDSGQTFAGNRDCPQCFIDNYGRHECSSCDAACGPAGCYYHGGPVPCVIEDCPSHCPLGEDCPRCPECCVCSCKTALCKECDRCVKHAENCGGCEGLFGGEGFAYCGAHGWVLLCSAHGKCPGRDEGECDLRPYAAGDPDCPCCQGTGSGRCCHPHCPGCWAEPTLRAARPCLAEDFPPPPPACEGCLALLTSDTLSRINRHLDLLESTKRVYLGTQVAA